MNNKKFLTISDLNVSLNNKSILNNLNLKVGLGETHVIMGPNGVGKSTLAKILSGAHKEYNISGSIKYDNHSLLSLLPEELSLKGIFLSFQNPLEIAGLSNLQFFKSFINSKRKYNNLDPIDNNIFILEIKKLMTLLNIKETFINRSVNEGFSGGEKKKNEILQMLLLKPKLAILDEIDSGLDVDSLKCIFNCINTFKNKTNSIIIITHYSRILDYINVDFVHILYDGYIIKTGMKNLIQDIGKYGYSFINKFN